MAKRINAAASANATNIVITATSNAYKQLNNDLGINPGNNLDKFIYYSNLQTQDGGNVLFNIQKAFVKP